MARPKQVIPSYSLHHATGQARVYFKGKDHYLGEYGSEESRRRYGEFIARVSSGLPPNYSMAKSNQRVEADDPGPSVGEVLYVFKLHADSHYVKNGKPTSEIHCYRACMRIVRELFGMFPAKDFGPLALKAVRQAMVCGDPDAKDAEGKLAPRKPWSRTNCNVMVGRIRRVFKHAVENEMIDAAVLTRLQSVAPLLAGRTKAHDNAPRSAVDQDKIDVVRERVRPLVKDLIDVQLLTGARSGELLMLTSGMIDRTGEVWKADLADHKCVHHGQRRVLHFGPQAKLILSRYLSVDASKPLFQMTRTAYCRAITRACEVAGIDRWTPHWLRHTFCTRIREQYGIEAAQSMAGHTTSEMTDHYSSKMDKLATQTAAAAG
jgi:integrase